MIGALLRRFRRLPPEIGEPSGGSASGWLVLLAEDSGTSDLASRFDPEWFRTHAGLAGATLTGAQLAACYLAEVGARQWSPNRFFDEVWYRAEFPDVDDAVRVGHVCCGFEHWLRSGRTDGRRGCAMLVWERWYLETYPQAAAAITAGLAANATEYHLLVGESEGLEPHPVFDRRWYLERYPEVARLVAQGRYCSAYDHFLRCGLEIGYAPSPRFDAWAYREANRDVDFEVRLGRIAHPYHHLVFQGLEEGRPWRPASAQQAILAPDSAWLRFDAPWYTMVYQGAATAVESGAFASAEEHYALVGQRQGLSPNSVFSEAWYLETYPGVREAVAQGAFSSGFEHFIRIGYAEGKAPCRMRLAEGWYRDRYPDVEVALADGVVRSALEHYLTRGCREGRGPSPAFDEGWYLRRYPDVVAEVDAGRWISGYHHFVEVGIERGYQPSLQYQEDEYLARHPDVCKAVEAGHFSSGYDHLVQFGLDHGRPWQVQDPADLPREAALALAEVRLATWLASGDRLEFDPPANPRVSVLLVLHNAAALTAQCLESLHALRSGSFEVVVVDNASADQTREVLRRTLGVRTIVNRENVGFLAAANQAAAEARGELLLFLNNDTIVLRGALDAAVARLDSAADIGVVGGRVLGADGKIQEAGCSVLRDASTCGYRAGDPFTAGAVLFPREVDYCSGALFLTRRALFEEHGGFDPIFAPAYFEEADYCFRLREAGWRTVYEPRCVVVHLGQGSLSKHWLVNSYLHKNRPIFLARHREALASAPDSTDEVVATRDRFRGRCLFLDDQHPTPQLGSGLPRARELVAALRKAGLWVTHCATNPPVDYAPYGDWGLEFLACPGLDGLVELLRNRPGFWDFVVVSRIHNLSNYLARIRDAAPGLPLLPLVYDSEAVFAERATGAARLGGLSPREPTTQDSAYEVSLAAAAQEVWAVSRREVGILATSGRPVALVSHAVRLADRLSSLHDRDGILFVGRLLEADSPNVDGMRWFLEEVLPVVDVRLGRRVPVTIVGAVDRKLFPASSRVDFLGAVPDIEDLYRSHRVFVAPCRFGAGVSIKTIEATGIGLPVVASSLVLEQLGWTAGVEILDGGENAPAEFAEAICRLLRDDTLWQELVAAGQAAVRSEYSFEQLEAAVAATVDRMIPPR